MEKSKTVKCPAHCSIHGKASNQWQRKTNRELDGLKDLSIEKDWRRFPDPEMKKL